eukprot:9523370-Ditylum_brightwellii.AAC.2
MTTAIVCLVLNAFYAFCPLQPSIQGAKVSIKQDICSQHSLQSLCTVAHCLSSNQNMDLGSKTANTRLIGHLAEDLDTPNN